MFTRVKTVSVQGRTYRYLHIVENRWEDGRSRQRIVGSLGRLDELLAKGDLKRVIEGLVSACPQVKLLEASRQETLSAESDRVWGPSLVFERLWEELGLRELLHKLSRGRRFAFDAERCAFALVLQRILSPGSDLMGSRWVKTVEADGFERLRLPHFYRTVGQLWRWKEPIEKHLYERDLDLFNQPLDLVFFDTTSTYFEGVSWKGWAKLGKSKDHRADHLQLVLGVVMRRDGLPVTCEIWPGNTADVTTVVPIIEALKKRFKIRKVVFVCDRGMVSKKTLQELTRAGYDYIVGMKMRGLAEVRDEVLGRAGRYHEVSENLQVKEVRIAERRYVVCFNPEEAQKDRHDREAILEKLRKKLLSGGVKSLINNRGYKRFLKVTAGSASIDTRRLKADERYDGKYVLRTTTSLPADEVATAYKGLTWIERLFRELKDVMELRPIYHHLKKDNVKGHIFGCFLALYLSATLRRRLEALASKADKKPVSGPPRIPVPWAALIEDLSQVRAIRVRLNDERYLMRTEMKGLSNLAFRAVGVQAPPLAQPLSGRPAPTADMVVKNL